MNTLLVYLDSIRLLLIDAKSQASNLRQRQKLFEISLEIAVLIKEIEEERLK